MEFLPLERYARKKGKKNKLEDAADDKSSQAKTCGDVGVENEPIKPKKSTKRPAKEEGTIKPRNKEKRLKHSKVQERTTEVITKDHVHESEEVNNEETENLDEPDENQKNRLLINLRNKKILDPMQVKELHPDITNIIFPRKKRSRWCWAVFEDQDKALKAFKKLQKHQQGVIVRLPLTKAQKKVDREKKLIKLNSKKTMKQKLLGSWM